MLSLISVRSGIFQNGTDHFFSVFAKPKKKTSDLLLGKEQIFPFIEVIFKTKF